ncbi:peptidoglycan-binding domain-containing protein [Rhodoligotrophos ferricapiens]|uniref:peptidoglycan-binding domain-containing protein n=1 Tax=Rhodoligotrophos ferricapiens TaxID=3069264 RepID=UPI00315C6B4A
MKDLLDETPPAVSFRGAITLGLVFLAGCGIFYNALIAQTGKHPAPFGEGWAAKRAARPMAKPDLTTGTTGVEPGLGRLPSSAVSKTPMGGEVDQVSPIIRHVQAQLVTLGYFKGAVDGRGSKGLDAAISAYQADRGLAADGRLSQPLLEQIAADIAFLRASRFEGNAPAAVEQAGASTPSRSSGRSHSSAPESASGQGERERMKLIQRGLAELGYQPGPADGIAGRQTREAIMQFQRDRDLPVTGQLDETVLKELMKVTGLSSLNEA